LRIKFILNEIDADEKYFKIITPAQETSRGCQLSILMKSDGLKVFRKLTKAGVVADWREPDVIRIAPVPLYNTFEEVWKFGQIFRRSLGL
jgi:kynureninase